MSFAVVCLSRIASRAVVAHPYAVALLIGSQVHDAGDHFATTFGIVIGGRLSISPRAAYR